MNHVVDISTSIPFLPLSVAATWFTKTGCPVSKVALVSLSQKEDLIPAITVIG